MVYLVHKAETTTTKETKMESTIKSVASRIIANGLEVTKENIVKMIAEENAFLLEMANMATGRAKSAFETACKATYINAVVKS